LRLLFEVIAELNKPGKLNPHYSMKIFVTGGCGMLGRAIVSACRGHHDVVVFDRANSAGKMGGVVGDIDDLNSVVESSADCDAIIHTAALHGGDQRTATTAQFISTNVGGSDNVFQAAIRNRIRRVVVASSMEALVGIDWSASGMTVLDEKSAPRPDWIYPVTKVQVEVLGSFYSRIHGLEVAQLRYVSIEDRPLKAIGFDLLTRTITPADAASATIAAILKPGLRDEIFHIGPDAPFSQRDITEALAGHQWEVLERHWPGCRSVLNDRIGSPTRDHFWPVLPIDKARLILSWKPEHSFESLLKQLGWKSSVAKSPAVPLPV
jgi:UDP-glucose 4-epimerase